MYTTYDFISRAKRIGNVNEQPNLTDVIIVCTLYITSALPHTHTHTTIFYYLNMDIDFTMTIFFFVLLTHDY